MRNVALFLGALVTFTVTAPAMAAGEARLAVSDANAKVLVQRGQEFLPALPDMTLLPADRIVILEGGSASLTCNGEPAGTFSEAGIHPLPACAARVASTPPATPSPTTSAPAAAGEGGGNWRTVGLVAGGAALIAVAAGAGGGGSDKPVSP